MKFIKKIFTKEGLKIIFSFMVISMIITLGFEFFLITYFKYVVPEGITIMNFWWKTIFVASIYSLLLLIIFWILSYFDK